MSYMEEMDFEIDDQELRGLIGSGDEMFDEEDDLLALEDDLEREFAKRMKR